VLPIIDIAPGSDGFPLAFRLVLREAQKYRAEHNVQPPGQDETVLTAEVRTVREFLKGTILVMIGGDYRDHAQDRIKEAFALKEVDWVKSRAHQSVERFRPHIMRDDVKVVLLMIRWASHGYGDIKELCDRHGKLFVRLPGGYGPNQVAGQIMAQCGRLLDKEARSCDEVGRPIEGGRVRDFEELSK
jgi:acetoin utilization deacetylase AcuC-like enzyme